MGFASWFEAHASSGYVELSPQTYTCDRAIVLPDRSVIVEGNNATIDDARLAFAAPANQAAADSVMDDRRLVIRDVVFENDGDMSAETCLDLAASRQSIIERCHFNGGHDTAIKCTNAPGTIIGQCRFGNHTTSAIIFQSANGVWTDATAANSGSNACVARDGRIYNTSAATDCTQTLDSDNCLFENWISEGTAANTHFVFNNDGNSAVSRFTVRNCHLENPTVTDSMFRCVSDGAWVLIDGFDSSSHNHTMLNMRGSGNECMFTIRMLYYPQHQAVPCIMHSVAGTASVDCAIDWDIGRGAGSIWNGWYLYPDQFEDKTVPSEMTLRWVSTSGGRKELTASELQALVDKNWTYTPTATATSTSTATATTTTTGTKTGSPTATATATSTSTATSTITVTASA